MFVYILREGESDGQSVQPVGIGTEVVVASVFRPHRAQGSEAEHEISFCNSRVISSAEEIPTDEIKSVSGGKGEPFAFFYSNRVDLMTRLPFSKKAWVPNRCLFSGRVMSPDYLVVRCADLSEARNMANEEFARFRLFCKVGRNAYEKELKMGGWDTTAWPYVAPKGEWEEIMFCEVEGFGVSTPSFQAAMRMEEIRKAHGLD